jgi:hypothetical protein
VELTTDPEFVEQAEQLGHTAEQACLVDRALAVPIEVELAVRTAFVPNDNRGRSTMSARPHETGVPWRVMDLGSLRGMSAALARR